DSIEGDSTSSSSSTAIYYNGLFDVDNPGHKLRISMTAQVTIVLKDASNVLTIPASALGHKTRDGSYIVPVFDQATEKVTPTKVTVGLNNKVVAEITSGLNEGDLIVNTATSSASSGTGQGSGQGQNRNILAGGGGPPPGAFMR